MKKLVAILVLVTLLISMFAIAVSVRPAPATTESDPVPIDIADTSKLPVVNDLGIVETRDHHSAWNVGDHASWLILDDYYGVYRVRPFTLRAIGPNTEIWVQDVLNWPAGDPRTPNPPIILDSEIAYLLNEFESKIYPTDTSYFGMPAVRNGSTAALPGMLGLPADYYAEGNNKNVILVSNIRDANYYVPTYPYYVAGFFSSTFDDFYFDRNIISIDCYRWELRLGPAGTVWIPGYTVNRPYVYESTIAHEYQHLIHHDFNPTDPSFMNEGCSMYAEFLNGYGIDPTYIDSYLYTPDNSLTEWGDQGDINILADYGESAMWAIYLSDHYGGATFLSQFVHNGIPGVDGVNAELKALHYKATFDDVFHDFRIANLVHTDFPGCKKYNYASINLADFDPITQHVIGGLPVPETTGTSFGNTFTILGYDTGVSRLASYGSDYIKFVNWTRPGFVYFDGDDTAQMGWSMTADGWWSGFGNLLNVQLISQSVKVTSANPTLTLLTKYGLESNWDFGFVQVSTDNGLTWTSLANENTTSSYLTDVQAIVDNLPGFTGYNLEWPGWTTESFDLSAYVGMNVLINFRYMTDESTNYEGWFINSASVSSTSLTLTPYPPYPKANYQVTIVNALVICGKTLYVPLDMWLTKNTFKGMSVAAAMKPSYAVMIVSPTMPQGTVDYKFQATKLPIFKFC